MLQKIRDGASGPLAYIVVGVIAVVFGVWGIGSYFTPSSDPAVASVGSTDITQSQLQRAFDQRYQRLRQVMGDHFDASVFPPDEVRQNVLDALIDDAVTTQYAQDAGYRVTDANLLATIRSNPQFQSDGDFSPQKYKALLAQAGMQPSQYEARLRQSLVGGQLQQIIGNTAFAAPPEVDAAFEKAHAQRDIAYLRVDPAAYRNSVSVDDAAIKHYYQQHQQQFMRPRRVKLSYVSLDANSLSVPAPSQDTLHQLFDSHQDQFGTPEKRSAEMIRIPIDGDDDAAARQRVQALSAQAKKPGDESLKQIAAASDGATFQRVDSQPQSALPGPVGQALFGLSGHALSNPVRGDDAWYLLLLTGTTPAKTPSFDDPVVQARLKAMAKQQAVADTFRSQSEKLSNLAYQAPNDLKTISDQLKLPIQSTDWISDEANGDHSGLGQYQAVRDAAFSDAVFKDKLNSKVLDLGEQRQVVLRVTDGQPAQVRPLAEVQDQIRDRLVADQAHDKAKAAVDKALAAVKRGTPLDEVAKQTAGASLSQPGYVGRQGANVPDAVLQTAFAMPTQKTGDKSSSAPTWRVASSDEGAPLLVEVTGQRVQNAEDQKKLAQQRQQTAQQQGQYNAALEYAALDAYLRSKADVDIHKDSLRTQDPAGG